MTKTYTIILGIALILLACGGEDSTKQKKRTKEERKQVAYNEIMTLEKSMMLINNQKIDTQKATLLSNLYLTYALNNIKDEVSPEFMFKSAELRMGVGQYIKSIEIFEQLNTNFPNHEKAPETDYLIAAIYQNNLDNLGTSEAKYKEVIKKYPNHHLAQDAKEAIKTLGMSDDELIKMFQQKNGIN